MTIKAQLLLSPKPGKKYRVRLTYPDQTKKKVDFGDRRFGDYTKHGNNKRKESYLKRHEPNEDWSLEGVDTAGFWSRWILWNQPSVKKSIKDLNRRFYNQILTTANVNPV
tara:strand:+ start:2121 stop:2450 length:330 start_codon:yes stop_codon:yes gene_type:complete